MSENGRNYDCIVKNWQLHTLSIKQELLDEIYPNENYIPYVFTGTVVEDLKERWISGDHMRSSLIKSVDRDKGIIVTKNTTYKVIDEGNDIFPDIGDAVAGIFY
jgi:hypothetical protein